MSLKEDKILSALNPQQLEAVTFGEGPLLIIAGAGTGKTRVITHRISYLISSKKAKPSEILALTFTDKAAEEMERRVDSLVPYGWVGTKISTFHSFGQRLIREFAFELGINPDFKVLSTTELLFLLKEKLFEFPLNYFRPPSNPTKYLYAFLNLISRVKDEDVNVEEYLKYAKTNLDINMETELKEGFTRQVEIANWYQSYEELLRNTGYVDIQDLIALPIKLFRTRPSILKRVQSQFKYILVDEFQDTNYAQFQFLKFLAGENPNLTVVGDDDQSIYKFRGACLSNILGFKTTYPDTHTVILNRNYRSLQSILDVAHRLITFNNPYRLETELKIDKSIIADSKSKRNGVKYCQYPTVSEEADAIVDYIIENVAKGYKYSDFAILVRTNGGAAHFLAALNLKGIPWLSDGGESLYDREEVKVLLNFLRVISNSSDSQALYDVISSPAYKLNSPDLYKCMSFAHLRHLSLYDALNKELEISEKGTVIIKKFLNDFEFFSKLASVNSVSKVLYEFLVRTGWLNSLVAKPSIETEIRMKNISEFFKLVEYIMDVISNNKLPFVINYIDSLISLGSSPPCAQADFDAEAVRILTVHKAKGLEFRVVFLPALVTDNFPHYKMPTLVEIPLELIKEQMLQLSEEEIHLQEERRLFYVGLTRAKETLILSSGVDYGGKREKKLSQFVMETLDIPKAELMTEKAETLKKISRYKDVKAIQLNLLKDIQLVELSSTGIDDWLGCPRKYWYLHWLRIPTPKHHAMIYGGSVHKAIESYLKYKKSGRTLSLEATIRVFESAWESEGFISREHEDERYQKGKEVLRQFWEQEEQSGRSPLYVEEEFSFICDYVKVRGRWDRVDEGGIIIDYKTGDVNTVIKANQRVRGSVQLPVYALAYFERFKNVPNRVEFHFVEGGVVGELKDIPKKIEKARETIKIVADGIRSGDFDMRPSYPGVCEYCSCKTLCPYKK
ncbi:MAG: ATP-dependent DNA helicase [bacterium]|nr:ATP-dependent DNA helicase [bacterium]